jgi:outer membrane protein assembly factor BamB/orotate phosphoribosyltransferase
MLSVPESRERLKKEIAEHAFITKDERELLDLNGKEFQWFIDIKGIMLKPGNLDAISEIFWEHLHDIGRFQLGGLETVAIALMSGVVMKAQRESIALNAFYVRKSRKRDGMQRGIEGALTDEPVILLDDAMNSGKSIVRQVEALKAEGKRVAEVCVIVAFRDPAYYKYFTENNIKVWSIFTLEDFPRSGGLLKSQLKPAAQPRMHFDIEWKFESADPRYEIILPKSAPVSDRERVYFGADNGSMWALNQSDGSVAWSYKTLFGAGKKRIFSSPALFNGTLFFGAYDGNFYALDAETGKKKWINFEADWIGSSPCVAEDLGLVYVGLEFGLWRKYGGIAAFDAETGERKWWYQLETHVHSSPAYSKKFGIVVVGSKSGEVCAFDASTGALRWRYSGSTDVKGGLAFDESRGLVIFGSWDDRIHMIDVGTGAFVRAVETYKPIYSNPVVWNGRLYMGLIDKRVVCVDIGEGKVLWEFWTQSRVFATPAFIDGHLFIGSNDGRLYEIDPETGAEISFFQTTERIVNKVAYNPDTKRIFLPTYANEMYCLKRASEAPLT